MAKIIWVTTDCFGHEVELSDEAWNGHILRKPDRTYMASYLKQVKTTIEEPELCIRDVSDALHFYRRGLLDGRHTNLYLHVVVRRVRGHRSQVKTAWACKAPNPGEEILWFKKLN